MLHLHWQMVHTQQMIFHSSGGTGKTKITCEGITVKDGQTYATIKFSSEQFYETGRGRQRISAYKQ